MRLEEEIKQTRPFNNNYEKTLVNIIYTSNWLNFIQNKQFKKYDISTQQYNVLRILNGQKGKPVTINEIIERMLDKMSNASRLVDKLFAKGYVERNQKLGNRRACDVTITASGVALLEKVTVEIKDIEGRFGHLNDKELDDLNSLLDKIRN